MTQQLPLADSKCLQSVDQARQQIERLVRERLMGRKVDGVTFVDEVLAIAGQVGEVHCIPVANQALRFELCGGDPFEVELDASRGKLRMLCARLAVLCQESGNAFMLYGGEGTIRRTTKSCLTGSESASSSGTWKARWINTPGKHEFTISAER